MKDVSLWFTVIGCVLCVVGMFLVVGGIVLNIFPETVLIKCIVTWAVAMVIWYVLWIRYTW